MSEEQLFRERFREFYQKNKSRLISFASGQATHDYSKEDLLQEAIAKTWDRLEATPCKEWWSLLCGKIVSLRIDRYWKGKEAPVDTTEHNTTVDEAPSPFKLAERSDDKQIVREVVDHMKNEQQRRVLELLLDNCTLEQVAAAMNISYVNARKLYQRARDALRETTSLRQLAKEMNIPTERPKP